MLNHEGKAASARVLSAASAAVGMPGGFHPVEAQALEAGDLEAVAGDPGEKRRHNHAASIC